MHVVHQMLLHDGRFALLDDEAVFSERRQRAFIKFPRKKTFTRPDGIGAIDNDHVVKILGFGRERNPVSDMDVKLLRRIQKNLGNRREIFF